MPSGGGSSGGSSAASGAMVSGMDETNSAVPSGQILTICPTVVYDTDGYVDNSDPTETALTAATDGLYLVTYEAVITGGPDLQITLVVQNDGPDNNSKATYNGDGTNLPVIWARVQQVVRLHAGDSVFVTIIYGLTDRDVHAVIGVGEPTGGWTITKLAPYPT